MLLTITHAILSITVISQLGNSQHCATKNSDPCIFPFEYQNKIRNACQPRENKPGREWCSIKVDRDGRHEEGKLGETWGICSSECPVEGDSECEETTQCVNKKNCPEYREFKKLTKTDPNYQIQRDKWVESVCNQKEKRLCCPKSPPPPSSPPTPTTTTTTTTTSTTTTTTTTTMACDEESQCIERKSCPEFRQFRQIPKSDPNYQKERDKWRSRICNKKEKKLCCPKTSRCNREQMYPGNYLPQLGQCGKNSCSVHRIFGGENANLGEFPWAALLGYKVRKRVQRYPDQKWMIKIIKAFKCGGTLINTRYVLTAAHCHSNISKISSVVLGELNANKDPDCPKGYKDESSCSPKKQVIEVESVIIHEGYRNDKTNGEVVNDIALIRLKKHAVLNKAVQPICLPINEENASAEVGAENLGEGIVGRNSTIIGWGTTKNWQALDHSCGVPQCILQKVNIPIISNAICQTKLTELTKDINRNVTIRSSHICALEENSRKDSCKGDSGGGMFVSKNLDDKTDDTYYQVGIVSFGLSKCGIGYPGVYTRVKEFIPWIKRNMQN